MTDGVDRARFAMLMQGMAATFRADLTEAQLVVTWMALKDVMAIEQMEQATCRALLECEYMPTPKKLLELAGSKLRVIDGRPYTWLEQTGWGEYHGPVKAAAASVGLRLDVPHNLLEGRKS